MRNAEQKVENSKNNIQNFDFQTMIWPFGSNAELWSQCHCVYVKENPLDSRVDFI